MGPQTGSGEGAVDEFGAGSHVARVRSYEGEARSGAFDRVVFGRVRRALVDTRPGPGGDQLAHRFERCALR